MDEKIENRNWISKFGNDWHLTALAVTLPWSILSNNIAIILFAVFQIWQYLKLKDSFSLRVDPVSISFICLFLLSGFGLFLTSDFANGLKEFEKHLVFLIFPVLIPNLKATNILRLIAFFSFSLAVKFLVFLFTKGYQLSPIEYYQNLPLHYPYFGIYTAVCGLFFLNRFLFEVEKNKRIYLLLFIFFGGLVYVSSSRNAQIYFFVSTCILVLLSFKQLRLILISIPIIILISGILFLMLPRFAQFGDALSVKKLSWLCSLEPLNTPFKWIFGVGTGAAQYELQECYYRHKSWFYDFRYNSHNQYLTFLLTNGIFSLLSYCILIGSAIWIAIRNKQILLFLVGFSLAISSLSESVLLVNKGIIFYTFWLVVLVRSEKTNS